MKSVLVTGAAGFVGSNLTKELCEAGVAVKALVRKPEQAALVSSLGATPVMGDLTDVESLKEAVRGVSGVYHIAALFRQAAVTEERFHAVNVHGTKNILDVAVSAGVKRFIHCSTVGVHGHVQNPPANEESPFNPGDWYQETKAQGEELVYDYLKRGVIQGNIIRPAMIYGPGDERTLKLFKMLAKRRFFYVGPGNALVHFIDVRDLARAFISAMDREDVNCEKFIIGGETSLPLHSLVSIICALIGVPEPKLHLPVKPVQLLGTLCEAICTPFGINPPIYRRRVDFFTKDRNFDCSKSHKLLGFQPKQNLVQELIDILHSYTESGAIDPGAISSNPLIVRDLMGKISEWNASAVKQYGWQREQALGSISHTLLNTDFPTPLEEINRELANGGVWKGVLKHKTSSGNGVKVESKWFLINRLGEGSPYVLESNQPISSDSFAQTAKARAARLTSFAGTSQMAELAEAWPIIMHLRCM